MNNRYKLFVFERNKQVAEALHEIIDETGKFFIKTFLTHSETHILNSQTYPDVIVFNISDDRDISFLSNTVVKHFSEAFVLLMVSKNLETKVTSIPVFKKIYFLYKPVPINLIIKNLQDAFSQIIKSNNHEIILNNGIINLEQKYISNRVKEKIYLTDKENLILQLLYQVAPNSLKKKELLNTVWGYADTVRTSTLETHIYRLRKKISNFLGDQELIVFKNGGYKLQFRGSKVGCK